VECQLRPPLLAPEGENHGDTDADILQTLQNVNNPQPPNDRAPDGPNMVFNPFANLPIQDAFADPS
jgi:hypothetical protein